MTYHFVRFWGVRGSYPAPYPTHMGYGGNTPCVEIRAGNDVVVLDAGTGVIALGNALMAQDDIRELHIVLTHYHWDHISGLPFFVPAFVPGWTINIYGPAETPGALAARAASERIDPTQPGSLFAAWEAVGFYGYYADPRLHILDPFALAEPLLARIPVEDPENVRIGHYRRAAPPGFMPSIATGENRIEDPDLARFYGALQTAVRGPLWSGERLRAILSVNLGEAKRSLRTYVARTRTAQEQD